MALVSLHQITAEMFSRMLDEQYVQAPSYDGWFTPKNQYVRYDAKIDRVVYEQRDLFYLNPEGRSPSDCRWMIPCGLGALEQESPYAI